MNDERMRDAMAGRSSKPLSEEVGKKEQRKIRARAERSRGVWFGLGMFGVVGWSIAVPTLIGIAIGLWIDRTWESRFSYTVMCLAAGVMTGCALAWYWIVREGELEDGADSSEEYPGSTPMKDVAVDRARDSSNRKQGETK